MSNKKLSSFDAVTTVDDADEFYVSRSGEQKKITGADLKAAAGNGGSSAPVAYLNIRGDGNTYSRNIGGDRALHAIIFGELLDQAGTGITWDIETPDSVAIVAGWYTFLFNDGWNAQADETADAESLWDWAINVDNADAGFQSTNAFNQTIYQKGGVWMYLVQTPMLVSAESTLQVTFNARNISSDPSDYSPELSIVRLADLT